MHGRGVGAFIHSSTAPPSSDERGMSDEVHVDLRSPLVPPQGGNQILMSMCTIQDTI
jgi:hypothetical protein